MKVELPSESWALLELLRLLNRTLELATDPNITDGPWWWCEIDKLCELMMPLWSQAGIDKPGLWIDRGNKYIQGPKEPSKMLHTSDPELNKTSQIFLDFGIGDNKRQATVREVAEMMPVVKAWIDWIKCRTLLNPHEVVSVVDKTLTPSESTSDKRFEKLHPNNDLSVQPLSRKDLIKLRQSDVYDEWKSTGKTDAELSEWIMTEGPRRPWAKVVTTSTSGVRPDLLAEHEWRTGETTLEREIGRPKKS